MRLSNPAREAQIVGQTIEEHGCIQVTRRTVIRIFEWRFRP